MERKPAIVCVNAGFEVRHPDAISPKLRGDEQKRRRGPQVDEVSGPRTTKPFPTSLGVDDALAQRKFTSLIRGDLLERTRE